MICTPPHPQANPVIAALYVTQMPIETITAFFFFFIIYLFFAEPGLMHFIIC